jgi:hypothetical protein
LDNDERLAEVALRLSLPGSEELATPQVPLVGYDAVAARLDNVFDAINALHETLVRRYTKRGTSIQPVRAFRPETAVERVKRRKSMNKIHDLEQRLTGGR